MARETDPFVSAKQIGDRRTMYRLDDVAVASLVERIAVAIDAAIVRRDMKTAARMDRRGWNFANSRMPSAIVLV